MIPLYDDSAFDWLVQGRRATPPSEEVNQLSGVSLSCIMPLRFERYAKILHRLDGHYENIDRPLTPEEVRILGIPDCTAVRELVMEQRRVSPGSRIFWSYAAEALGVPYAPEIKHSWFSKRLEPHPECWPRFISGPAEGTLDQDECLELVSLLNAVTGEQLCRFRLAAIPFIATDQNLLFSGRLDEVMGFFLGGRFQFTPEYWWPVDRSWCVCTDYDLEFTIVGGPSALIDALLRSEILECIEVSADLRVDYLTPMP